MKYLCISELEFSSSVNTCLVQVLHSLFLTFEVGYMISRGTGDNINHPSS